MAGYRVISQDSHVIEPAGLWTSRIESRFRDRAPRVVRGEDGDWWWCDSRMMQGMAFAVNLGVRFEDPDKNTDIGRYEDVPLGGYLPDEHIKDMDADGIDAGVLFPSYAFKLYNTVADSELLTACFRVYNDWALEFSSAYPDRLHAIAMLNMDDIAVGIKELERCVKLGSVGAMIPVFPPIYPHQGLRYWSREYEPLWATAQDLGVPLHLHILTNRLCFDETIHGLDSLVPASGGDMSPSFTSNHDYWPRMSLGDIIFSGVFERYPKLQVGSVEYELSWIPHFLDRMDYTYTQRPQGVAAYHFKEDMLPSEYFHRNVFAGFQEDGLGVRDREIIGVDNLCWGSDYPHAESTFPRSRDILDEILNGCTEEEKAKIAGGNTARIYRLD